MDRVSLTRALEELRIRNILSGNPWLLVCDAPFHALFREWDIPPERMVLADEMEGAGDKIAAHTYAVVCTEKPEGATQHRLKEFGIQTTGLFSQMVPKLAAGVAPRFNAAAEVEIKHEFAIMCLPRCGSTLVSKELKAIGAGDPIEHFRGFIQELLKERQASKFNLIKWWSIVRAGRSVDGVFGTKIIFDFWRMADRFMLEEEREHMLAFLKRVPVIYINRSDKYGQAVSDVIARKTGVWHLWNDGMKKAYQDKLATVGDEMSDAIASYQKFRRSERDLAAFLEAHAGSIIKVEYEDLVSAPKDTIAAVGRQLGLEVPADYRDSELSLQPTTSETHRLLKDQLRRELS